MTLCFVTCVQIDEVLGSDDILWKMQLHSHERESQSRVCDDFMFFMMFMISFVMFMMMFMM